MTNEYLATEQEEKMIAAMDDLLAETPAYKPKTLAEYWSGSASQSVTDSYKDGPVIFIGTTF